jgi:hypothetical protein
VLALGWRGWGVQWGGTGEDPSRKGMADDGALPRTARVRISGLASRADLNGVQGSILAWHEEKQRYSVQVLVQALPVLLRPINLLRLPDPTSKLDDDTLLAVLGALGTWQDAARAMAARRSWRDALRAAAWPRHASATAPRHWKQRKRFGSDWTERMPFAKPPKWASPTSRPSWTCALQGMSGLERVPSLLEWLDSMEETWPGSAVTRWPGIARRLAWVRGQGDSTLQMHELRGCILREWPPNSGDLMHNCYLDGGCFSDSTQLAPHCQYELPADAALFFALMPSGFGEGASDGSFSRPYHGFQLTLKPFFSNQHIPDELVQAIEGCEPTKMLLLGHTPQLGGPFLADGVHVGELANGEVIESRLLLCCDTTSDKYGTLLLFDILLSEEVDPDSTDDIRRGPGYSNPAPFRLTWTNTTLAELLVLIFEAADEVLQMPNTGLDRGGHTDRARTAGMGKWDLAWAYELGALKSLCAKLRSNRDLVPSMTAVGIE